MRLRFPALTTAVALCACFLPALSLAQQRITINAALAKAVAAIPGNAGVTATPPVFLAAELLDIDGRLTWDVTLVRTGSTVFLVGLDAYTGATLKVQTLGKLHEPGPNVILARAAQIAGNVVPGFVVAAKLEGTYQSRVWHVGVQAGPVGTYEVTIDANTGTVIGVRRV